MTVPKAGKRIRRKGAPAKRGALATTPRWATRDAKGRVQVNVAPAKAHLSELLERVARGEGVVLARDGAPIAELNAVQATGRRRVWGLSAGKVRIADDFNATPPGFEDLV